MMKFSLLMTVYNGEKTELFDESLKSVLVDQTVLPDQFVLVYDGPVHDGIMHTTEKYRQLYKGQFDVIRLERNQGQGVASKAGLERCIYPLIARMDSDDISVRTRFERQLRIFEEHEDIDVVGGHISEFIENPEDIKSVRRVPEKHKDILEMFKQRNPINNVTVMFKKSALERAGGYSTNRYNEDFNIYVRLLISTALFYNIQDILVRVRIGSDMLKRRGNIYIFKAWRENQKLLKDAGIISSVDYLRNCMICYIFVKCPQTIKKFLYKFVLRR